MSNRSNGILTKTDRGFLRSDGPYYTGENARQSRYDRKKGIRERITGSILDFNQIEPLLDAEQRERIFTEPEKNGADNHDEFQRGLESLLRWVYLGCRESELGFEQLVERAAVRGEEDYHRLHGNELIDVDAEFDVEVTDRYSGGEKLAEALEDGEIIPARAIYKLPMVPEVPVDPEKVETVRIGLPKFQFEKDDQIAMIEAILREHLDIEANVEIEGVAELELPDEPE